MILYFSGTGNSEYAAKRIGKEIQDEVLNLFERIRNHDDTGLLSERPWVIVTPTYAWRIPRIVEEWLMKTELSGSREIYFVMTCGGDNGNAGAYLKKLCAAKKMAYRGCISVVMPENYIALFRVPDKEESLAVMEQSEPKLKEAAGCIKDGREFPTPQISFTGRINSGVVNDIFYPLLVHAKKFYSTNACVSCGLCERVCPTENIRLENGRPVWGKRCTHCMACINRCPKEAIEYGKNSQGKPRYVCPKEI